MMTQTDLPSLITIENGHKATPTFSLAEYQRRQGLLRQKMAELQIDGVLFTSYHNINYYGDFLYCSFGRFYGLVVTPAKVVSISANIDGGQPWRRTVGDYNVVYTDWQRDNYFKACAQELPNKGRIGIEMDNLPLERFAKLQAAMPQVEFVDISAACMRMRMVKSAEEIEFIKNGANVCDIGGFALRDAVAEGVPEHEVALASTQAMIREIARRYPDSELMDTWTWFQSGINTDGAHNPVTTRKVQKGDILSLNCFSMISGYYTALERTMFFNHVDDASLKLWEVNVAVHEAGLALVKPGIRCCDIAHELNKIYEAHDLLQYRTFGYGHSFGVLSHYYGREAGLELREDIDTVLEPGMVISIEPMIMLPEGMPGAGGYREHDILVVGESGAENITKFPYGPEHNIISQ
ncbi:M24 family metallopeptidase [Vitreoscilla massiliensis]|uniref:M24 family metallopeptidase n=1 Tax=Vitreoscilla massiliensis TaxID=1689272 RepID=A0ABY4E2E4_9NEIS|nr:M24 family metallopeptidase [Vitreoscilla massiliensis]UOO89926.1 M24 family metallopeptidase [Vitreoscilla massiliensis]